MAEWSKALFYTSFHSELSVRFPPLPQHLKKFFCYSCSCNQYFSNIYLHYSTSRDYLWFIYQQCMKHFFLEKPHSVCIVHHSPLFAWLYTWASGAMVARLTPDQKVECSSHSGVTYFFTFFCRLFWRFKNYVSIVFQQTILFSEANTK